MNVFDYFTEVPKAASNTAYAAHHHARNGHLRQALTYSRFGGQLIHVRDDPHRLESFVQGGAEHSSVLAHIHSLARGESPKDEAIKETVRMLEPCTTTSHIEPSSQRFEQPQHIGSVHTSELEQYSKATTKTLYETFYTPTILPCSQHNFCVSNEHNCTLRLDGIRAGEGDSTHCFFYSAIAPKDEHCRWAYIQFQVPRITARVNFSDIAGSSLDNLNSWTEEEEEVKNICEFVREVSSYKDHYCSLRLQSNVPNNRLRKSSPEFVQDAPQHDQPVSLFDALSREWSSANRNHHEVGSLSAKSKIRLAFILAKSVWQFYESDWMRAKWSLDSILLLPRKKRDGDSTLDEEAETPFLKIDAPSCEMGVLGEEELLSVSGNKHYHPYPYLLKLGLLLVSLCSDVATASTFDLDSTATPVTSEVSYKINGLYFDLVSKVHHNASRWPLLDLSDDTRTRYRNIVKHCVPLLKSFSTQKYSSPMERRAMLRDHVVIPLHELSRGMDVPHTEDAISEEAEGFQVTARGNMSSNKVLADPSEESKRWIDLITKSKMHAHISSALGASKVQNWVRRPRIAIIDTGYARTKWFTRTQHRIRFNLDKNPKSSQKYHFSDFWGGSEEPCDDDGHGTSMLSIIMKIAPFADVCVARVASSSKDLHENAVETSNNVAKAIEWAAKNHQVDIISMSFGWEDEPLVDGYYAVSNAIAFAMKELNQNVLFFAAASNYGGDHKELYPAKHSHVFSIRATNSCGSHQDFNPGLVVGDVHGTLGVGVPAAQLKNTLIEIGCTGTSAATAVATGIAAHVIGYIHSHDKGKAWSKIKTNSGFKQFLPKISGEVSSRKHFISLRKYRGDDWETTLEADLQSK